MSDDDDDAAAAEDDVDANAKASYRRCSTYLGLILFYYIFLG